MTHTQGPFLILAGPGTGKTRTLVTRAAYIVEQKLASPHTLLILTFTRKAATEVRERLQRLVGVDFDHPWIAGAAAQDGLSVGTFHSLCYRILHAEREDSKAPLKVLDASRAGRKLRQAVRQLGLDERRWQPKRIGQHIARAKDQLIGPEEFVTIPGDFYEETVGKVYARYQELLRAEEAVDFQDLQRLTIRLLEEHGDLLAYYQEIGKYVLVDEFQDVSQAQYRLLQLLSGKYRNLCCVGSPSQAIYSWRGADMGLILSRFRQGYPDARVIVLKRNYRSTPAILRAAQAVIRPLGYQDALMLTPERRGSPEVVIRRVETHWDEALFVANEILRLREMSKIPWAQFAVLYRANRQGWQVERVFTQREIPYTLAGGTTFFRRMEVVDLLAYLKLAADPTDPAALERVINKPPRGVGPVTLDRLRGESSHITMEALLEVGEREDIRASARESLQGFAQFLYQELWQRQHELGIPQLIDYILQRTGYGQWVRDDLEGEERWANIQGLREMAIPFDRPARIDDFLDELSLDWDRAMEDRCGVTLSTIHESKGLEFDVVFIIGLVEGILPHAKALKHERDPEEERRLCYVAMTRSREREYLLWTTSRLIGTRWRPQRPSRYLGDVLMERKGYGR